MSAVIYQAVRSNLTGIECLYTDGGLLDQYPIQYFDGMIISIMKLRTLLNFLILGNCSPCSLHLKPAASFYEGFAVWCIIININLFWPRLKHTKINFFFPFWFYPRYAHRCQITIFDACKPHFNMLC